ncbi:hypothetical protein GGQ20_000277 [Salinibacter ruber]|uniref:hypothetical protein n=1 Tax=Salinibacter ruber TaxID=146919 RepID=UPI001F08855C|nr:hypothetical protein [Salinibacter ruber]MCS3698985.1 hypothetical protein [Salinibacter ruber]
MIALHRLGSTCRRVVAGLAVGLLLWGLLLPAASAQQTHTLNIRDGTVYVDGQPLSADQLPDSLDLRGVRANYRFVGIQRPVVELKGRLFVVQDGLRPITEEEVRRQRASVVLGSGGGQARASSSPDGVEAASAPEASHRQYLDAVQRSSRELYERLQRERQMEQNARNLARTIRLLPEGAERRAQIDTLRAMLEDIFAVKQENRRREIERLQRQICELQENLQRRAQMRDRMIDRHLRQLIDSTRGR